MGNCETETNSEKLFTWVSAGVTSLRSTDRNSRRNFLKDFQKKVDDCAYRFTDENYRELFLTSYKPLLTCFQDPVEKCRELSAYVLRCLLLKQRFLEDDVMSLLMGTLSTCLASSDERENSEEVRLIEVDILTNVVKLVDINLLKRMNDVVHILSKCIVDPYPEIKYRSCECASEVAFIFRKHFHMCSGTIINPLLQTIIHQHARTRIACIMAIGSVVRYGDNQKVKDVLSHLAQRLFDSSPSVRLAVVHVIGMWLVELPDRYSYFPQLLPLLLSALSDDFPEVSAKAKELWEKTGSQYLDENEKDYKDQLDFPKPTPEDYLGCQPTFGCRVLVQRYYSNILPALIRDIDDWLAETRVKSADLLYTLMLHCEEKATMNLHMMIDAVVFAAKDEEKQTIDKALRTAELIGYFIDSRLWSKHLLVKVSENPNFYHLGVLSAVIRGHGKKEWLGNSFDSVCKTLSEPHVCRIRKPEDQANLLLCVEALLSYCEKLPTEAGYLLFTCVISVAGLSTSNLLSVKCSDVMNLQCSAQSVESVFSLYKAYALKTLKELAVDNELWTSISPEMFIFIHLVRESCGLDETVSFSIPVIIRNLQPDRDAKLRSHFLSLVTFLLEKFPAVGSDAFASNLYDLVHDGLLPNLHWSAGKTSAALRAIAVANLWKIIHSGRLSDKMMQHISGELLPLLNSLADDDLRTNRLLACQILEKCLPLFSTSLDAHEIHNTIQEFIRCLDDEFDETRIAAVGVFREYFKSFPTEYEWIMYRPYLQCIYKNMLIHMDDQKEDLRNAIFELLKEVSFVLPETLLEEAEAVKGLMNASDLCFELTEHVKNINLSNK